MQLVIIEAASKLLRRRVRAVAAAAPPCCGTTPYCADRFLSMQTRLPRVRHEQTPWHGNCTNRSSQLRDSCGTMQPSAGGSGPCPRLRTLPHRFPDLAPPACKRAAATRHSSAPTPAAQRTTRRCPFPVRCRLSPARPVRAVHAPAGMDCACRAFAAVPRDAPLLAAEAERNRSSSPRPSAVPHLPDVQRSGLARAAAHTVAPAHAPQPDHAAAAGSPY